MSSARLKGIGVALAAGGMLLAGILPAQPGSQHDYPDEGTVISATIDHGHVYTLETDDKILQVLCVSLNPFRQTPPECKIANRGIARPIARHDKLHFRREGDMAFIPAAGGGEQRLVILSTELKVLPPLPDTPGLAPESAAVLGLGMESRTLHSPTPAAPQSQAPPAPPPSAPASSPSTPTGPVLATPVTGGPPVLVNPTGPVTGGVITGVPVTGGSPITAIPVGPTGESSAAATSTTTASTPAMTSAPTAPGTQWIHFVRVQTAAHVYDLGCAPKSCSLEHNPIQLGDLLTLRFEKKSAYLSRANTAGGKEQKFDILDVRSINDPPSVPPHQ